MIHESIWFMTTGIYAPPTTSHVRLDSLIQIKGSPWKYKKNTRMHQCDESRGAPMAPNRTIVDFYIVPVDSFSTRRWSWYLYDGKTSHCLAIYDELEEATKQAIKMAEYRASLGKSVQIHVKQEDRKSWKTVWRSSDENPRFP